MSSSTTTSSSLRQSHHHNHHHYYQHDLLLYTAVGKLAFRPFEENGTPPALMYASEGHEIIAARASPSASSEQTRTFRQHLVAVMERGANKLIPGQRIRLTPDEGTYELHVQLDLIKMSNSQSTSPVDTTVPIIFYAVTAPNFDRHHPVFALFNDFRSDLFRNFSAKELHEATTNGKLNKQCQDMLAQLLAKYRSSPLHGLHGAGGDSRKSASGGGGDADVDKDSVGGSSSGGSSANADALSSSKTAARRKRKWRVLCQWAALTVIAMILFFAMSFLAFILYRKVIV